MPTDFSQCYSAERGYYSLLRYLGSLPTSTAVCIAQGRKCNTHVCVHTETRTHKNRPPHAEVDAHLYTDVSTQTCPCSPTQEHAYRQACTQRPVHPDAHTYMHERVLMFALEK